MEMQDMRSHRSSARHGRLTRYIAVLVMIALTALGILFLGATNIAARYMHPILFVAPVYVFARVARLAPRQPHLQYFAWAGIAAAVLVLVIRFVAVTDNPLTRYAERALLIPYAGLADALAARGIAGTVVTPSVREAGNLRAFIPELRVNAADSLRVQGLRHQSPNEACHLVWMEGQEHIARAIAPESFRQAERIDIPAEPRGIIASRPATWFVAPLDPQSARCG